MMSATCDGTCSTNALMRSNGSAVDVGLFGLQTMTRRVAALISAAIASRSCSWRSFTGTLTARAPDAAASCG